MSRIEITLPYEFEAVLVAGRGAGSIYQEVYRPSNIQQTAERGLCGLFKKQVLISRYTSLESDCMPLLQQPYPPNLQDSPPSPESAYT
mgnify:CR=1 FL=1|jgi:hypothetical protein